MTKHYVYTRRRTLRPGEADPPGNFALLDGPFATADEACTAVGFASTWLMARAEWAYDYQYGHVAYHDDERAIPAALMRRDQPDTVRPAPTRRHRDVTAYTHRTDTPTEFQRLSLALAL